jgi:hypothetical protein
VRRPAAHAASASSAGSSSSPVVSTVALADQQKRGNRGREGDDRSDEHDRVEAADERGCALATTPRSGAGVDATPWVPPVEIWCASAWA